MYQIQYELFLELMWVEVRERVGSPLKVSAMSQSLMILSSLRPSVFALAFSSLVEAPQERLVSCYLVDVPDRLSWVAPRAFLRKDMEAVVE